MMLATTTMMLTTTTWILLSVIKILASSYLRLLQVDEEIDNEQTFSLTQLSIIDLMLIRELLSYLLFAFYRYRSALCVSSVFTVASVLIALQPCPLSVSTGRYTISEPLRDTIMKQRKMYVTK
jgi:hypothetical protein